MPKAPAVSANGANIPAIGFGTWPLQGRECSAQVELAIEVGYRHIDTAIAYFNEAEVGAAIRSSNIRRDEIFLTTKLWYTHLSPDEVLRNACESLERLKLDYIDLLLVHWPNPEIPLAGTMRAFNELHNRGAVRHLGVSNFPSALLREAINVSETPLAALQVEYHPYLDQSTLYNICHQHGMALVAFSPLHQGGELLQEPAILTAARRHDRTPAQVVLRWLTQHDGVVALPRTSNPRRVMENISVFDFSLDDEEMLAISALTRRNHRISNFEFSPKWDEPVDA